MRNHLHRLAHAGPTARIALAALALATTPAHSALIPGGDFQMYKPGTSYTVTAEFADGSAFARGVGDGIDLAGGTVNYSDLTSSVAPNDMIPDVDLPGWAPLQTQNDLLNNGVGGSTGLNIFASWGGNARIQTTGSLLTITAGQTITITTMVGGPDDGPIGGPLAFHLLADGVQLVPTSFVDPTLPNGGAFQMISRTYSAATLAPHLGKPTTIVLGVENANGFGNRVIFDDVSLTTSAPDTTPPTLLSMVDNKSGGPVVVNEPVTYTVTFSEAMAAGTVDVTDFANTSLTAATVDSVSTTLDPAVFLVGVTPTESGTLQLQVVLNATLTDLEGNPLDTDPAILDDTTIVVDDLPPTETTIVVVSSGNPTTYGQNVTFTATVDPVPSGGTVQFLADGNYIGSPVAVNTTTGEASVSTSTLGAGSRDITAEYSGNFQFASSNTVTLLSQVVNQAPLTVTASSFVRQVNTANPDPLPYAITGFQNGEVLGTSDVTGTPLLTTDATLSSPVGTYTITCALDTLASSNYSFTLVNGTLTVSNLGCQLGVLNLSANGGINPATGLPWALGDTYRLIFVTSATTETTSTDIATYNTFVQGLADAAGLGTSSLGPVTWKVVGSTATVDARDNTSTNPGVNGVGEPIARMDGTFLIANNYADLWNGIVASHEPGQNFLAVHLDENGSETIDERVRTGSSANGTASATEMLGAVGDVQTGRNFAPDAYGSYGANSWMADWHASGPGRVYALSGVLTIISTTPTDPYEIWLGEFTFAEGDDTTPTGDPDGDGLSNQEEFAFGLDPTLGSSVNPIVSPLNPATGNFQYTRRATPAATGLTYTVLTSTDLAGWAAGGASETGFTTDGNIETVTVNVTAPPVGGKLFVRVEAAPTP